MKAHGIVDPHFGLWGDSPFSNFFGDIFLASCGFVFRHQKEQVAFEWDAKYDLFLGFFDREFALERGDLWGAPLGDMIVC